MCTPSSPARQTGTERPTGRGAASQPRARIEWTVMTSRRGRSLTSPREPPGSAARRTCSPSQRTITWPSSRATPIRTRWPDETSVSTSALARPPKSGPSTKGIPSRPQSPTWLPPKVTDAAVDVASARLTSTSKEASGPARIQPVERCADMGWPTSSTPDARQPSGSASSVRWTGSRGSCAAMEPQARSRGRRGSARRRGAAMGAPYRPATRAAESPSRPHEIPSAEGASRTSIVRARGRPSAGSRPWGRAAGEQLSQR